MGYYIQAPSNHGKADWLIKEHGAEESQLPVPFELARLVDKLVICVVDNGEFEAAAIAFSARELEIFSREEGRPKRWLILPRAKVIELCPEVEEVL